MGVNYVYLPALGGDNDGDVGNVNISFTDDVNAEYKNNIASPSYYTYTSGKPRLELVDQIIERVIYSLTRS